MSNLCKKNNCQVGYKNFLILCATHCKEELIMFTSMTLYRKMHNQLLLNQKMNTLLQNECLKGGVIVEYCSITFFTLATLR